MSFAPAAPPPRATMVRLPLLLAAALILPACAADGASSRVTVTARDSAGIEILEHGSLDSATVAFEVGPEPLYRVGHEPGGRTFENIADAAVLDDGRVAVADIRGTQEIVVLGTDGAVQAVLGGRGEGPGEFTDLYHVEAAPGGRIMAQESWGSITVFHGSAVEHTLPTRAPYQATLLGGDAGRVFLGPPLGMVMGRLYPEPWRRVPLVVLDLESQAADSIAEVDWDQSLDFSGRDPFAASGFATVAGNSFVIGRGDRPELRWLDTTGRLERIVRWADGPAPVADSMLAAYEDRMRGIYEPRGVDEATILSMLEGPRQQHQGTVPYFDGLFAGPAGTVLLDAFIRTGYAEAPPEGRRMFVIGPDGRAAGILTVPTVDRFTPLDFGDHLVVGRAIDSLGVHSLVAYPVRPGGG